MSKTSDIIHKAYSWQKSISAVRDKAYCSLMLTNPKLTDLTEKVTCKKCLKKMQN